MSYTTVNQLTSIDPLSGEIENGNGFLILSHSFFYAADVLKVLEQSKDATISNLQIVNVKFDRNEPTEFPKPNHERNEISVLALKKSQAEQDETGSFDNRVSGKSKWHDIVAVAWPPYYRSNSVKSLVDGDNPEADYNGLPFEGSRDYIPGALLLKEHAKQPQRKEVETVHV